MKSFLLLAFSCIFFTANATTYFFSATGNDANDGISPAAPWKTINKFNSVFADKNPGDNFVFNRGDVFYGTLIISRGGSAGLPITIGAYGTGDNPVITGFTSVTDWTYLGANIWESTAAVSTMSTCNMVSIRGVNTAMGRTPNFPDYYNWDTHSGNASIKAVELPASPNWKDAELAIFTTTYKVARHPITAQSGSTISFSSTGDLWQNAPDYFLQQFFIQNDPRTLDVENEWYFNPSTKKLRIFSTSMPSNVQLATLDTLAWTGTGNAFTSFNNISFTGSNSNAIDLGASTNIEITNCSFNFMGQDGIFAPSWGQDLPGLTIENCKFNQINNCGIDISRWFTNSTIRLNRATNIGMLIGMAADPSSSMGTGIFAQGAGSLIEYNTTDSTGLAGIRWRGSNTHVNNNIVERFCMGNGIKDGGGIYTFNTGDSSMTGSKVFNNIVLDAGSDGRGIYFDEHSNGAEVYGNTISGTLRGIYLHNAWNMNVHHNTTYDNFAVGLMMVADDPSVSMTHITIKNNIFVAKTATENPLWTNMLNVETMPLPFTSDSNYFARPIDDDLTIQTYLNPDITERNLAGWQELNHQDAHTNKSPKSITNVYDLRLEYNTSSADKTISLDGTYIDVKNESYNGTITLKPYTSAVLIRNGDAANQAPKANAGPDQTITLPTNTVTLSGSGTDEDGTISGYSWRKVSGSSAAKITKAGAASTTITGMVAGTYQFELKVIDDKGAPGVNTVQVIVNSTANLAPTVSAGADQTITTTTATLNGSATDDGNIASYAWTKISGSEATIASPESASTSVTGLVSGTYRFQLMATDNNDATAKDTVEITVTNLLPAVNPANTVDGLDYSYYESGSTYSAVPDFSAVTPLRKGTDAGFNVSVADKSTQFALKFSGFINVPSDGQYTFYSISDDGSNLYIDNVPVVNNDGVHSAMEKSGTIGLKAGKHAISVGYFQQTGRLTLTISYKGPGVAKQNVPESSLSRISNGLLPAVNPANTVNGLDYNYYESRAGFYVLPQFSNLTPVKTGTSTDFDISWANKPASFAFNFTGYISVPTDGQYTFYTSSDDGSNLYIDNVLVVNNDGLHRALEKSGIIGLQAGKHAISVGFFQAGGFKSLAVNYKGPGITKQVLPTTALYRISNSSSLIALGKSSINQIMEPLQVAIQAYPSPFAGYIKINIPEGISGEYKLMLVDASGKVLWAKTGIKNAGSFQETVNTSALTGGIYFLKVIQNNTTKSVIKLVK